MQVGILTSGGDCPGLNAAIRGVSRAAQRGHGINVIGFRDGFRGLVHDWTMSLDGDVLSGILTNGGTILGTSRDKPNKMMVGGRVRDMTRAIVETYKKHHLDALVCIGGGGTQKNALRLSKAGLNVVTLPKTIDNDVAYTDVSFGYDTALGIASEAIDRLHSTATSHHRIIVVEIMGHRAGWLALGAGIAGGADVILIPEIPYDVKKVAQAILERRKAGKRFSIVAVAEGAMNVREAEMIKRLVEKKTKAKTKKEIRRVSDELTLFHEAHLKHTVRLSADLERLTGQESRLTILGHLQRGGTPSAGDRLLATRLGTSCAEFLSQKKYGIMCAAKGDGVCAVPLVKVCSEKKLVPPGHPWVLTARRVGVCLGD